MFVVYFAEPFRNTSKQHEGEPSDRTPSIPTTTAPTQRDENKLDEQFRSTWMKVTGDVKVVSLSGRYSDVLLICSPFLDVS